MRRTSPSGKPDELPFILAGKDHGALKIAAVDQRAAALGLTIGMTLADARARVPLLRIETADKAADDTSLIRLAEGCEIFTPLVALDPPEGLLLDITGCAHLFGGEKELRTQACRRLNLLGPAVRAAIAGTPDAARAFARFGRAEIAAFGEEKELARALPVTALGVDAETTLALARAGLKTLGDLADRPSKALSARFGMDLVARLDRILGREDIRIAPLRAPADFLAERHFPEPLAAMESLLAVIGRLACDIVGLLEKRGRGGRAFEVIFFRADGAVRRLGVEMAQASRDAAGLLRLLRLKIETLADPLDPGFGFDAIRLAVSRSELLSPVQGRLDGGKDEDAAVADLVNRLVARFGRDRVLRFVACDTHDPVRAAGCVPILSETASAPWPALEPGSPSVRPLTLFEPPQLIEALAEVPDGPPLRFRWRRVLHEVALAEGPERIAPEWWRGGSRPPATCDYYRIEDAEGRRFWVFREGLYQDGAARPRWFLHGLFA